MKKHIFKTTIIFFLSITDAFIVNAQVDSTYGKHISGGFCHLMVGLAYFNSNSMNNYLKMNDKLGPSYTPSTIGYTLGLEANKVFDRFILGIGGLGIITPSTSTDSGRVSANLVGGYIKVGYKFYEKSKTFILAYANFGGSGYTMSVSNLRDYSTLNFNHKAPIAPNKKQDYSIEGFLLDVGISLKTLGFSEQLELMKIKKGLILGADAGAFVGLPINELKNGNNVVVGPPHLNSLVSPYLRFTIGFGNFKYSK